MKLNFTNVSTVHNRKKQIYNLFGADFSFMEQQSIVIMPIHERSSSSLLNLISGIEQPTRGKIQRNGIFTGPVGESFYFHRELSGEENIRFICKIYGQDSNKIIKDMKDFAYISKELRQKTKTYPPLLRRKIALSVSLLMKSDIYQFKAAVTHPQANFNANIQARISELAKESTLVIANGDNDLIHKYAKCCVVINAQGQLQHYYDVQSGVEAHKALKEGSQHNAI